MPLVLRNISIEASIRSRAEAARKPSTNFGKRSQITPAVGRSTRCAPACGRIAHQIDSRNAASPISTFCENFTTVPIFIAVSPSSAEAATTLPVVSSVPPIQAPATGSDSCAQRASHGCRTIIGTATINTVEVT